MRTMLVTGLLVLAGFCSYAFSQFKTVESIKDKTLITYRLSHPLHTVEATSKEASFRADIDPSARAIRSVTAQVDVTTFDSGNSNRDSHAMEVIDAIDYPDVTFASTKISPEGDSLEVTGTLTFHGLSRDIVATVIPKWSPEKLDVEGAFKVSLTEFKIDRPSLLMMPVSDTLRFSLRTGFALQ